MTVPSIRSTGFGNDPLSTPAVADVYHEAVEEPINDLVEPSSLVANSESYGANTGDTNVASTTRKAKEDNTFGSSAARKLIEGATGKPGSALNLPKSVQDKINNTESKRIRIIKESGEVVVVSNQDPEEARKAAESTGEAVTVIDEEKLKAYAVGLCDTMVPLETADPASDVIKQVNDKELQAELYGLCAIASAKKGSKPFAKHFTDLMKSTGESDDAATDGSYSVAEKVGKELLANYEIQPSQVEMSDDELGADLLEYLNELTKNWQYWRETSIIDLAYFVDANEVAERILKYTEYGSTIALARKVDYITQMQSARRLFPRVLSWPAVD